MALTSNNIEMIREIADILMALKPATYIRYMYEDMFNGRVDDKFSTSHCTCPKKYIRQGKRSRRAMM